MFAGVDTGGTFTDIVFQRGREAGRLKLPSTPDDPARAVLAGLRQIFGDEAPDVLVYGTTVATNAMLERRGARTLLLTTAGFEDVLAIGRQARPDLYALEPVKTAPLVEAKARLGVSERMLASGKPELRLTTEEVRRVVAEVERRKPDAVAVCLLHAPANAAHELRLGRALKRLGIPVTLSHQLSPQRGEFERTTTAVCNAYVRPNLEGHIGQLAEGSQARAFRVLQSNGGGIGAGTACQEPIRTMLSGPAGGVAAAHEICRAAGFPEIVTLDMGGTSTDVAMVDGAVPRRADTLIAEMPIRTPCIDIHTVGAGGGSIAYVDDGGALKVGPQSAGADPGPACYGRGTLPTVTDANVVLGRLRPESFLGGDMDLHLNRAQRALHGLGKAMGTGPKEAAEGIIRVVEGNMERAVRVITVQRGHDPRSSCLVPFGGAAGLHACGLAEGLGMQQVLIPPDPGLLSAAGVLRSPVVRDATSAVSITDPDFADLRAASQSLRDEAVAAVRAELGERAKTTLQIFLRARYLGQSMEIEVPLTKGFRRSFEDAHERLYHHRSPGRAVEVCGDRKSVV